MRQIIGLAIVIVGVSLLLMGISESDSFASDVSRFFTGNPTNRTIWLSAGGIVAILIGLGTAIVPARLVRR